MKFKKQISGIAIFVVLSSVIALVVIALKSSSGDPASACPEGQTWTKKCGCVTGDITCKNGFVYDCKQNKCVCNEPLKECSKTGSEAYCCPVCDSDKGLCCDPSQVGKDSTGKDICCGGATIPSPNTKRCVSKCGNGSCPENHECMTIKDLSNVSYDSLLKNLYKNNVVPTAQTKPDTGKNNGTISYCVPNPTQDCVWDNDNQISSPSVQDDRSLYFRWDAARGNDADELCFPNSVGGDPKCFDKSESDCSGNCTWKNIFDYFNADAKGAAKQLENWQQHQSFSQYGWFCEQAPGNIQRYTQLTGVSVRSGNCTVHDCISKVANVGTAQIEFDESTKFCSALRNTAPGGISLPNKQIACKGENDPCIGCEKGQTKEADQCTQWEMQDCSNKTNPDDLWPTGLCPFDATSPVVCNKDGQVFQRQPRYKCNGDPPNTKCIQITDPAETGGYESETLCINALNSQKTTCRTDNCFEITADSNGQCACTKSKEDDCAPESQFCFKWNAKECQGETSLKTGQHCNCNYMTHIHTKGDSHGCQNDWGAFWGGITCQNQYGDQDNSLLQSFQCSGGAQGWACNCNCGKADCICKHDKHSGETELSAT